MSKVNAPVRVRFSPSPTGFLHIGGIRSALFDWLLARQSGGQFILRIEDTDRERLVEGATDYIIQSLKWLGLDWDEGPDLGGPYSPYIQSDRLTTYQTYANQLTQTGQLYPCWCTPERLAKMRSEAQSAKKPFKYDRHCLAHPGDPNQPHVLRFKIEDGPEVSWEDKVRGPLSFNRQDLDDFVAIKSDGYPTYNFAVVIDDHDMEISHVLRGDEFLSTTPKNLLIYDAFGWAKPTYAHLPQVLGRDKAKLSKRHGAKPVLEYRDEGYLPDAIINFLVLLGWNEGDGTTKELYTRTELIKAFSLDRIQKSPAVFDPERLDWFNGLYIRSMSESELDQAAQDFWPTEAKNQDVGYKHQVLGLVRERLKNLAELAELTEFFFTDPKPDEPTLRQASSNPKQLLENTIAKLEQLDFNEETLEAALRPLAGDIGVKTSELFGLIRLAVTGRKAAPGLFETLATLGRETSLRRLQMAASIVTK